MFWPSQYHHLLDTPPITRTLEPRVNEGIPSCLPSLTAIGALLFSRTSSMQNAYDSYGKVRLESGRLGRGCRTNHVACWYCVFVQRTLDERCGMRDCVSVASTQLQPVAVPSLQHAFILLFTMRLCVLLLVRRAIPVKEVRRRAPR
jgi:hypothetical protein